MSTTCMNLTKTKTDLNMTLTGLTMAKGCKSIKFYIYEPLTVSAEVKRGKVTVLEVKMKKTLDSFIDSTHKA